MNPNAAVGGTTCDVKWTLAPHEDLSTITCALEHQFSAQATETQ
jgi:hypothetical protein